jgi:hypothetical protein
MKYDDDEDDLERCRRVRREIDASFKSLDEMFDFLAAMDKARLRKGKAVGSARKQKAQPAKAKAVRHRKSLAANFKKPTKG